jgi:cobalamin biosynthesis protein CbiG
MPLTPDAAGRGWPSTPDPARCLVIGVGARAGTGVDELAAAIQGALDLLSGSRLVWALATLDRRAAEAGVQELARSHGWRLLGYPAAALDTVSVPHPDARIAALIGTPSVAEAAALLGARALGEPAVLLLPKRASRTVTVAVASGTPG